jgi:Flp pilus assembly protein TadD
VAPTIDAPSRSPAPRKRLVLVAAILAGVGSVLVYDSWPASRPLRIHERESGSSYENTRPGVKYLGDAACVGCHAEIARTYREHPMGRSLASIESAPATAGGEAGIRPLFVAQGFEYSVEDRDGHVIHLETRRDASGRVIARAEGEVRFVVGSGRMAIAYLIERDGFLFQSPIAWYVRQRRWDLPPGYEKSNRHFDLPIQSVCLSCHANRSEPVEGTVNRYRPPFFAGHAIGCERCHGPGERHVAHPKVVDGRDVTIVNPAALEPALRDAVCQQCHLNGQKRVLRAGRRDEDYRPGLPFQRFWTVLEGPSSLDENHFVGQFEQMYQSRCYRASRGRLGCITCHDPHRLPGPDEAPAYFRDRCLECHSQRGCSLPVTVPTERGRADDCVRCHMPRLDKSDIIHVAETNHRIPRRAGESGRRGTPAGNANDGRTPWVIFHGELMDDRDRAEAGRDVGVALCLDGPTGAAVALSALEEALAARPGDVPGWEAKGYALGLLHRDQEGLAAFRRALALEPNRESALTGAAYSAAHAGHREDAIASWRRAVAVSPWRAEYRAELASAYFQGRDWRGAEAACREALRLDPANLNVRKLLVRSLLRLGDRPAARGEFATLIAFDPPDRDQLRGWFTSLANPRSNEPGPSSGRAAPRKTP